MNDSARRHRDRGSRRRRRKREEYAHYMWQRRQRKGLSLDEARRQLCTTAITSDRAWSARGDADALRLGREHALSRDDPAGARGDRRASQGRGSSAACTCWCSRSMSSSAPTRRSTSIRPPSSSRRSRYAARRIARTIRHRAAHRDALVLELRLGAASRGARRWRDAVAAAARSATRRSSSTARCRPTRRSIREILERDYPFSALKEQANVLIFPNLSAGNIAYKMLHHLGGATAIGPILVGMRRPVHVLERGADVQDIVNMAAVAVVDAQERVRGTVAQSRSCADDILLEAMRPWRLRRSRTTTPDDRTRRPRRAGLRPAGSVHWNLVAPELIEHAVRRGEGELAEMGPFVRRHGAAHRPLAERQVRRARSRRRRSRRRLGQGQPADRPTSSSTRCSPTCARI